MTLKRKHSVYMYILLSFVMKALRVKCFLLKIHSTGKVYIIIFNLVNTMWAIEFIK